MDIREFIQKKVIEPYRVYQDRNFQKKVVKEERKARLAYFKSAAFNEKLSQEVQGRFGFHVKEVNVSNKVRKPEIDATEEELLGSYGASVWVYSACNAIAEKLASVSIQLMDENNELVENEDETIQLIKKPNPKMTRYDLFEITQLWMDTTGNAYWYLPKGENVIFPLRPSKMAIVPDKDGTVIGYAYKKEKGFERHLRTNGVSTQQEYRISDEDFKKELQRKLAFSTGKDVDSRKIDIKSISQWKAIETDEIIHFKYQHPNNDYYGMSPLQPLLTSIQTELYARQWNLEFFKNGAVPLGIMIVPDTVDPDDWENMKESWAKEHEGVKKAHRIAWLNREVEYKQIELSQNELDFLNLLRLSREDILAALNVPPVMVGVFEFSNTSSRSAGVREQRKIFWEDCIIPKLRKLYDKLNLTFYADSPNKLSPNLTNIEALQKEWIQIAKGAKEALVGGGLSLSEVREIFWDKHDLPDDPIYLPTQAIPITSDGNIIQDIQLVNASKKKHFY